MDTKKPEKRGCRVAAEEQARQAKEDEKRRKEEARLERARRAEEEKKNKKKKLPKPVSAEPGVDPNDSKEGIRAHARGRSYIPDRYEATEYTDPNALLGQLFMSKKERKAAEKAQQEAKKAQADAEQYEREKDAEAQKAIAEAQKYSMVQEAEGIRAKGEAEAAAIRAKALAEAEGMEKKAEAYQKYNKAAMAEMMIQVLPEIAGRIAEPLSQIDKITIIGSSGDTDNGIGTVAGNVPVVMAKLFESMKETTGVDLAEIMKADTYDAKVTRNVNLTGAPDIVLGSNAPSDSVQPER